MAHNINMADPTVPWWEPGLDPPYQILVVLDNAVIRVRGREPYFWPVRDVPAFRRKVGEWEEAK